jgi:hypothetical protein
MLLPCDRFPVPGDQDLQKDHTREQRDLANHGALSLVPAEGGHGLRNAHSLGDSMIRMA